MNASPSSDEEGVLTLKGPKIEKRRLEAIRRTVFVQAVEDLTSRLRRITFNGEDLAGFHSPSPDDHIKLFFKNGSDVEMRDYTPRRFDAEKRTLTVDFVLHKRGAATDWARQASVETNYKLADHAVPQLFQEMGFGGFLSETRPRFRRSAGVSRSSRRTLK